jgi:hypothetical protein
MGDFREIAGKKIQTVLNHHLFEGNYLKIRFCTVSLLVSLRNKVKYAARRGCQQDNDSG